MVRLWGPVIIIEDNDKVVANPMQPLHREEDVLELVIRDLTYAVRIFLKWQPPKDVSTHGGAKGMLAKVYLARSGWKGGTRDNADLEKAKELAADVINNSGTAFTKTMKTSSSISTTTIPNRSLPCSGCTG